MNEVQVLQVIAKDGDDGKYVDFEYYNLSYPFLVITTKGGNITHLNVDNIQSFYVYIEETI